MTISTGRLDLVQTQRFTVLQQQDDSQGDKRSVGDKKKGKEKHRATTTAAEAATETTSTSTTHTINTPQHEASTFPFMVISIEDLLLHSQRMVTVDVQSRLYQALKEEGFCLLRVGNTRIKTLVQSLQDSLVEWFPTADSGGDGDSSDELLPFCELQTSDAIYISEKGVPMYKLGYELCEDRVRQVFRIAAGDPDSVMYPNEGVRELWIRNLALCRSITDAALDLLLSQVAEQSKSIEAHPVTSEQVREVQSTITPTQTQTQTQTRLARPYSTSKAWLEAPPPLRIATPTTHEPFKTTNDGDNNRLRSREGDFSVFYAMHYFNNCTRDEIGYPDEEEDEERDSTTTSSDPTNNNPNNANAIHRRRIAVKSHVDPSLLVLEPFLCSTTTGLQVWNRRTNHWLDCDGPDSPLHSDSDDYMLLFVGKALGTLVGIEPTRHRVVVGHATRRTAIYEQKYQEFYPAPILD